MTCGEMRDLAEELECWDAAMLDGGGSSALWIDGAIRNVPSDGSPRTVANHIGIVYADAPDPICPFPAGAWCEGSVLRTCNGSLLVNEGDCAAFGTACQEESDWAFCVNPDCSGGDGMGSVCSDATAIEVCTDESGSSCMDPACAAGPNGSYCCDDDTVASCTTGVFTELQCEPSQTCGPTAKGFECVDTAVNDDPTDDTSQPHLSPGDGGGCGCSAGTNRLGPTWSALLLIGLVVVARRRTRS